MLTRAGARPGDEGVTGTLGEAAVGLQTLQVAPQAAAGWATDACVETVLEAGPSRLDGHAARP